MATCVRRAPLSANPNDPRSSRAIPTLASCVPLLLAVLRDPEAVGFDGAARELVVGLGLASDRSYAPPLGTWLAPLSILLPIGPLELRAAVMMALPAAFAAFLVGRRVAGPDAITRARGAWAIALAFALTSGVLLGASSVAASIAVIAIECALLEGDEFRTWAARGGALALAAWCAPRMLPAVAVAMVLGAPKQGGSRALRRAFFGVLPIVALGVATALARSDAWLALGRPFSAPTFAAASNLFPRGALLRAALACAVLGIAARGLLRTPTRVERLSPIIAGVALASALLLRAPDATIVGCVVLAPLAVSFAGGLSIAVERHLANASRYAIVLLVPALALGLAARAFEVELAEGRIGDAAVAHDVAPILTLGVAPPRGVLIVEDEEALLRFAHARLVHGLRPDLRVLPAQALAAGGAARMANATIAEVEAAADPLRALLARGTLEPSDASPLALKAALLTDLPFTRVRNVSRYVAPTGGPLVVHLERIDPSDRRLRRPTLERRIGLLARLLSSRPPTDRVRRALRIAATREARALSLALDRDGALAAVEHAASFGADPDRTARWTAKLAAKQSIDLEPATPDD